MKKSILASFLLSSFLLSPFSESMKTRVEGNYTMFNKKVLDEQIDSSESNILKKTSAGDRFTCEEMEVKDIDAYYESINENIIPIYRKNNANKNAYSVFSKIDEDINAVKKNYDKLNGLLTINQTVIEAFDDNITSFIATRETSEEAIINIAYKFLDAEKLTACKEKIETGKQNGKDLGDTNYNFFRALLNECGDDMKSSVSNNIALMIFSNVLKGLLNMEIDNDKEPLLFMLKNSSKNYDEMPDIEAVVKDLTDTDDCDLLGKCDMQGTIAIITRIFMFHLMYVMTYDLKSKNSNSKDKIISSLMELKEGVYNHSKKETNLLEQLKLDDDKGGNKNKLSNLRLLLDAKINMNMAVLYLNNLKLPLKLDIAPGHITKKTSSSSSKKGGCGVCSIQ